MKVALVHDWLTGMRGGERCLNAFLAIYPEADIFTMLHVPGSTNSTIDQRVVKTSFLQNLPRSDKYYRLLLPLYPKAISQFDFSGYDLVISLSHAAAKNIHVPKDTKHISYCFTPMRYIWDQAYSYFGNVTPLLWPVISSLRRWDVSSSEGVSHFVAISRFVAARIRNFYTRSASVIYPPVDVSWIKRLGRWSRGEAFLYAGALAPYKKVDVVIDAFNELGEELWVLGRGQEEKRLKARANKNIKFLGAPNDQELGGIYRQCRALLFPGTEDFGIVPIECLASGRPVIASYSGALKESLNGVKPWNMLSDKPGTASMSNFSGVFIEKRAGKEVQALIDSVKFFLNREQDFLPETCIRQAERFSPERFFSEWRNLVIELGIEKDREREVVNLQGLVDRELVGRELVGNA
jgi:glycosyltransferase involved in cell wall biosynthesis